MRSCSGKDSRERKNSPNFPKKGKGKPHPLRPWARKKSWGTKRVTRDRFSFRSRGESKDGKGGVGRIGEGWGARNLSLPDRALARACL